MLRERYWDGVAHNRPPEYWMWGNLAALAFSAGPARLRRRRATTLARAVRRPRTRVVWWLVAAGDGDGRGRGPLPDEPGRGRADLAAVRALAAARLRPAARALAPPRASALQVVVALVVQHLLLTGW